jgi:hypothetical protein
MFKKTTKSKPKLNKIDDIWTALQNIEGGPDDYIDNVLDVDKQLIKPDIKYGVLSSTRHMAPYNNLQQLPIDLLNIISEFIGFTESESLPFTLLGINKISLYEMKTKTGGPISMAMKKQMERTQTNTYESMSDDAKKLYWLKKNVVFGVRDSYIDFTLKKLDIIDKFTNKFEYGTSQYTVNRLKYQITNKKAITDPTTSRVKDMPIGNLLLNDDVITRDNIISKEFTEMLKLYNIKNLILKPPSKCDLSWWMSFPKLDSIKFIDADDTQYLYDDNTTYLNTQSEIIYEFDKDNINRLDNVVAFNKAIEHSKTLKNLQFNINDVSDEFGVLKIPSCVKNLEVQNDTAENTLCQIETAATLDKLTFSIGKSDELGVLLCDFINKEQRFTTIKEFIINGHVAYTTPIRVKKGSIPQITNLTLNEIVIVPNNYDVHNKRHLVTKPDKYKSYHHFDEFIMALECDTLLLHNVRMFSFDIEDFSVKKKIIVSLDKWFISKIGTLQSYKYIYDLYKLSKDSDNKIEIEFKGISMKMIGALKILYEELELKSL